MTRLTGQHCAFEEGRGVPAEPSRDERENRDGSPRTVGPTRSASDVGVSKSRLWLWFVIAFALQLAAWAAWFIVAAHHKVQEVPVVVPR